MPVLNRIVGAVVAGAALSLAFEPVAFAYVLPFAVAALGVATRGLSVRAGFLPGYGFGLAFYLAHTFWMSQSIGTGPWIGMSLGIAAFYGLFGSLAAAFHRLPFWPGWLAVAWVGVEQLRSVWPFSGMPWGRLAFAVIDTPVAESLAYVGTAGLSALLALIGFLLAWVVLEQGRDRVWGAVALGAVGLLSVVPAWAPYRLHGEGSATVAVVQGNVPGPGDDILYDSRGVTRNHVEATLALAEDVRRGSVPTPDFVLWPENATASDPFREAAIGQALDTAAAAVGVPILVGAIVEAGPGQILNQGLVWDPVTGSGQRYTKHHPVTFGEYIPFRTYLDGAFDQLDQVPRDMLRGVGRTPLRVGGVSVADAICFDVAYEDGLYDQVRRGAEMLTVQTSNAVFIFTDQVDQQFAITRLRAIETGRWLAVASTNGITAVVAPDGSVVAAADRRTRAVLIEKVELMGGVTPAVRLGAWPARASWALSVAGLLLCVIAYRRRRQGAEGPGEHDQASHPGEEQLRETPVRRGEEESRPR